LPIGTPRISVTTVATHARGGTLLFKILDENGEPVSYPPPRVEAPSTLAIETPRPTGGAGVFVAAFERLAPANEAQLHVRVGDDRALAQIVLVRDVTPATSSEPRRHIELSLAGLGVWQRGLGAGAELELRGAFPVARGESSVLVGMGASLAAVLPSSITVDAPNGEEVARTSISTTSIRPLVGYRIEGQRFSPYVTVGPEILRQRVEADLRDGTRRGAEWLFGGSLALGVELRLGKAGALFLEARGRAATALESDRPSVPASGALLLLGGRIAP